ncbi:hypothetical protein SAMN02982931_04784 [Bauldia litoralis]|uniref:Uncharacterized protein n=2 Tax=Bauldia litoralis TaxID=665467 RepID=A0A1G6EP34_9HYPH|nr:hypothetical protein SAMN02982931_04784 [Bauldia litoralis]
MELVSARAFPVIGDVHHLAEMNCMVQPGTHARAACAGVIVVTTAITSMASIVTKRPNMT